MMEDIVKEATNLATPTKSEVTKASMVENELKKRLEKILKDYNGLEYKFLGSYARNTWLRGNLEIDVFILFPEDTPIEELEKKGLEIGKSVVDEFELRYAAHPYVRGRIDGTDIDVVPCYSLKSAENIKSAVDRTPFHHDWLKKRIGGKESDVRILKRFLKSSNLYGAEYSVRGFSGYLCELLILYFGSFQRLIEEGSEFTRTTVIDVINRTVRKEKSAKCFTVVDPVDSKRNVAANLSVDNLAKFVEKCRKFIENPSIEYFEDKKSFVISPDRLRKEILKRNTGLMLVEFEKPDIVEDNLFPQLERACKKTYQHLLRKKFSPIRTSYHVTTFKCYLLFETEIKEVARVEKRMGPPFENNKDVKKFIRKETQYKPFLEDGRYYIYRERKDFRVQDAIINFIKNNKRTLGKNLASQMNGLRFFYSEEIFDKFEDEEIRAFVGGFLGIS